MIGGTVDWHHRRGRRMTLTVSVNEDSVEIPFRIQNSLAEFREWAGDNDLPEKSKVFFHRGEVWVYVGKEQLYTHILLKTEITSVLYQLAKRVELGICFRMVRCLTNETAELPAIPMRCSCRTGRSRWAASHGSRGRREGSWSWLGLPTCPGSRERQVRQERHPDVVRSVPRSRDPRVLAG